MAHAVGTLSRRGVSCFCFAIALAVAPGRLPAQWRATAAQDEPSRLTSVVHRHLELEEIASAQHASLELTIFASKSCGLRVIDNGQSRVDLAEALSNSNYVAGVNGGYFDPDFRPLGLRVAEGKINVPLAHGRLMSGIVASNSSVAILRVAEFSKAKKFTDALECGPMLIDRRSRIAGLEPNRIARRSFAAVDDRGRAALGCSSEVTLAGLSEILTGRLGDFQIQRALNLDGGSSTAFCFKLKDGTIFSISEEKTVRDFLAVVPK